MPRPGRTIKLAILGKTKLICRIVLFNDSNKHLVWIMGVIENGTNCFCTSLSICNTKNKGIVCVRRMLVVGLPSCTPFLVFPLPPMTHHESLVSQQRCFRLRLLLAVEEFVNPCCRHWHSCPGVSTLCRHLHAPPS